MNKKVAVILLLMIILLVQVIYLITGTTLAYFNEDEQEVEETEIILNEDEIETYNLINEYRKQNGLDKLGYSTELQEVAKIKAEDLLNSNEFAHESKKYGLTNLSNNAYGLWSKNNG